MEQAIWKADADCEDFLVKLTNKGHWDIMMSYRRWTIVINQIMHVPPEVWMVVSKREEPFTIEQ